MDKAGLLADLVGVVRGEGEGIQGIKEDEAGFLPADMVGEVLWKDKRIQGTKEDEGEQAEEVGETMFVEAFKEDTATLAQTADFPTTS